jgi:tetratricopeptide (TPR) repeat protein
MVHDEERLTWSAVVRTLAARIPVVALLEGDAGRRLAAWRSVALKAGVLWLESPSDPAESSPFRVWTQLATTHPSGVELVRRLRFGPDQAEDPGCPILPDPGGAYSSIYSWLVEVSSGPLLAVVKAVDQADQDCLAALDYIIRALEDVPVALFLQTSGQKVGGHWDQLLPRLISETRLIHIRGRPLVENPSRRPDEPSTSLEHGIACCRAGALHMGSLVLLKGLIGDEERQSSRANDATAWSYLAMAMLNKRQFHFVSLAVAGALALETAPQRRRLLRRTLMIALRGQGNARRLHQLGIEARQELAAEDLEPAEEAWLRLDAALGCSLDDPEGVHESLLRSIVDLPDNAVSPQCRAAAHVWLAAFLTVNGDPQSAIPHQRAGLAILESLEDESRSAITRVRLGAALFGAGSYAESAAHFEIAARRTLRTGDHVMTAECLCYAARAHAAMGELADAVNLLAGSTRSGMHVWSPRRARLLRLHAQAVIALARGDPQMAEAMVGSLLEDLETGADGQLAWTVRLTCECAYLLADIAAAQGDSVRARRWTTQGLRIGEESAPEERAALIASGRKRLMRP